MVQNRPFHLGQRPSVFYRALSKVPDLERTPQLDRHRPPTVCRIHASPRLRPCTVLPETIKAKSILRRVQQLEYGRKRMHMEKVHPQTLLFPVWKGGPPGISVQENRSSLTTRLGTPTHTHSYRLPTRSIGAFYGHTPTTVILFPRLVFFSFSISAVATSRRYNRVTTHFHATTYSYAHHAAYCRPNSNWAFSSA
jgi:hypothetical protein